VQVFIHVDDIERRVVLEFGDEFERLLSIQPTGFGQGDEFGEDVAVGEPVGGRGDICVGVGVLRPR
jgi:hypothetical protein